jgi:hypothetical protein
MEGTRKTHGRNNKSFENVGANTSKQETMYMITYKENNKLF